MPVVRASYATEHTAPFVYMISAFPFFGVLCGEAVDRVRRDRARGRVLVVQIVVMGLFAVARLGLQVPLSGHILLQVFFVASVPGLADGLRGRWAYGVIGWGVLAVLLWTKLVLWHDFVTPSTGAAAALLILLAGPILRDHRPIGARRGRPPSG